MSWKHIGLFVVYDYFGCIEKRRNLFKMVISAPVSIKKTSYFPDDDDSPIRLVRTYILLQKI